MVPWATMRLVSMGPSEFARIMPSWRWDLAQANRSRGNPDTPPDVAREQRIRTDNAAELRSGPESLRAKFLQYVAGAGVSVWSWNTKRLSALVFSSSPAIRGAAV